MKRLIAAIILAFACIPCLAADRETRRDGPNLLAAGQGYNIHIFNGAVQGKLWHSRVVQPGTVILHTDTKTGQATWIIRTGVYEIPTRRISYSVTRLLGLLQTDTHIVTVSYYAGKIWDRPPRTTPPDKGGYRLSVFVKESGMKKFDVELKASSARPKQVPEETTELGVIQKTDGGFSVLGTSFLVLEDGRIKQKSSQQSPAGDDLKAAPEE